MVLIYTHTYIYINTYDQVNIWRRSYDVPPPAMDETHEFYAGKEAKYASWDTGKDGELPMTECLKDCVARFLPWFNSVCIHVYI